MGTFAIISLVLGVIMSAAGMAAQAHANQQNIEQNNLNREDTQAFNAEEAEKARQANIDQYNLLYSPSAKVQQYKDAGLSPALMYSGGGAASAGGSTQMASAGMAGTPTINPIVPQSGMLDMLQQITETQKTEKESKKTEAETKETMKLIEEIESKIGVNVATTNNLNLQNKLLENEKKISDATIDEQINIIKENYELIKETKNKTVEEINNLKTENANKQRYIDAEIRNMDAQTELYVKQQALTTAQALTEEAKRLLTVHQDKELQKRLEAIESYSYMVVNSGNWQDKGISFLLDACKNLGDKIKEYKDKDNKK